MNDNINIGISAEESKKGKQEILEYLQSIENKAKDVGNNMSDSLDIDSSGASSGVDDLSSNMDSASSSAENLGKSGEDAMSQLEDGSDKASVSFNDLAKRATMVAGGITAIGAATFAFMKSQAAYADDMSDMARIAGMQADEFVRISHAVELSGMSMNSFAGTMRDIKKATSEYVNYGTGRFSNLMDELSEKTDINIKALSQMAGNEGFLYLINSMRDAGFSMDDINGRLQKLNPNIHQITDNLVEMADGALGFSEIDLRATETDYKRLAEIHAEFEGASAKVKDNFIILASTIASLDLNVISSMSGFFDNIAEKATLMLGSFRTMRDMELQEVRREIEMIENAFSDDSLVGNISGNLRKLTGSEERMAQKLIALRQKETLMMREALELRNSGKELTEEEQRKVDQVIKKNGEVIDQLGTEDEITENIVSNISDRISETDRLISSIGKEAEALKFTKDTVGMTASEVIKYRMAQGDLNEAIQSGDPIAKAYSESLLSMTQQLERIEGNKEAQKVLEGINRQMAELGMSDMEKSIFTIEARIEGLDIDEDLRDQILKAREELYLKDKAKSFIEQAVDDVDLLKIQLEELESVRDFMDESIYTGLKESILQDIEDIKISNDELLSSFRDMGSSFRDTVEDSFISAFEGDFQGALDGMVSGFRRAISQMLAEQALASLGDMMAGLGGGAGSSGGFGAFLGGMFPGRRSGGYTSPGQTYMVGETGPELFTPSQSGSIDNMSGSGNNNSSNTNNININIGSMDNNSTRKQEQAANKIAAQTAQAINRTRRRGDI